MKVIKQQVKDNLIFLEQGDDYITIDPVTREPDSEKAKGGFSDDQKDGIRGYIDYLYDSPEARNIFNKITKPIKIVAQSGGFFGHKIPEPVVFLDPNVLDGNIKFGYISESGEYIKYDLRLAFMHELIHPITGLPDTEASNDMGAPSVYSSAEASLGATQIIANKIHTELGVEERVSYDGSARLHESGQAGNPSSIEEGTQFTQGKIVGTPNTKLDIAAFISGNTFDKLYPHLSRDFIDTSEFENYDIETTDGNFPVTTIDHVDGTETDGTDTLEDVEWAIFSDRKESIGNSGGEDGGNQAFIPAGGEPETVTRIVPLPLVDGVETTEVEEAVSTIANPNPNNIPIPPHVSLTAPVAMLDGDVDYILNISPYEPDTEYNVVYIIDTSSSIKPPELQTIKDAYTDLTNFYINEGIAENINFGIASFDSSGRFYTDSNGSNDLTANEALAALQNLTTNTGNGTLYFEGLSRAEQFLSDSPKNPSSTTGIGYFFTDGQDSGDRFNMLSKARDVRELANLQAIALVPNANDPNLPDSRYGSSVNWIDSTNQGTFIDNISELPTELLKSDLADDVAQVNILVDGEIVDTLTPDIFTDNPLGLTYEGSVENLDVSIDAENEITAEVVYTPESNLANTNVDFTVTAGESDVEDAEGNPIAQSNTGEAGDDPFENTLDGSEGDDKITLGYVDRGANGGAGGDEIIGNERDNILDGGAGNDTISAYGGDDTVTPGSDTDRDEVDGGEGIDTVLYSDTTYQNNSNISIAQTGNSVSYNNTDTLTNIEYLQFSDVRISAQTLEITPIVSIEENATLNATEGETVSFNLELDAPSPTDITFDYSTQDLSATAGLDYTATSGQITIPAGETSATVEVATLTDTLLDEDTEELVLALSGLSGATFDNNQTESEVVIQIANIGRDEPIFQEGTESDDTLIGGSGNDSLAGLGGSDRILGRGGNDELNGGTENDIINGEDGADTLEGEGGNDILIGGAGDDSIDGGTGGDRIQETADTDFNLTDTQLTSTLTGTDTFTQVELALLEGGVSNNTLDAAEVTTLNLNLQGQQGNDTLKGGSKNDQLYGQDGNDRLLAGAGNDVLRGGTGEDTLFGQNGNDTILLG